MSSRKSSDKPKYGPESELDQLVDYLAKRLGYGDREKLANLIRRTVESVLQGTQIDDVLFRVASGGHVNAEVLLQVVPKKAGPEGDEIATFQIKDRQYYGVPDDFKGRLDEENIPDLTKRRSISLPEFRHFGRHRWLSTKFVKEKRNLDFNFKLDFELE